MKSVVIYSGGMDSYTLLALRRHEGDQVAAVSFNYGQRHVKELEYARKVCSQWSVPHHVVDLQCLRPLLKGSALTDDIAVPEGHYADENMKLTVVPNRNMVMLAIATAYAVSIEAEAVFAGVHAGDHAIYPDCRPEFVNAMDAVCRIANYHPVRIHAPLLHVDKGDILRMGLAVPGTDYADTWTCYKGQEKACGKCGSCTERLEAFAKNGVKDPLPYEA